MPQIKMRTSRKPKAGPKKVRSVTMKKGGKKGYITSTSFDQNPGSMSYIPDEDNPHASFADASEYMRGAFGESAPGTMPRGKKPSDPQNQRAMSDSYNEETDGGVA